MSETRIVLDVWGGEHHLDHVARFLPRPGDWQGIAERELLSGYLVNMRSTIEWGPLTPFDDRTALAPADGSLQ